MGWSGLTIRTRTKEALDSLRKKLVEKPRRGECPKSYSDVIDHLIEFYRRGEGVEAIEEPGEAGDVRKSIEVPHGRLRELGGDA